MKANILCDRRHCCFFPFKVSSKPTNEAICQFAFNYGEWAVRIVLKGLSVHNHVGIKINSAIWRKANDERTHMIIKPVNCSNYSFVKKQSWKPKIYEILLIGILLRCQVKMKTRKLILQLFFDVFICFWKYVSILAHIENTWWIISWNSKVVFRTRECAHRSERLATNIEKLFFEFTKFWCLSQNRRTLWGVTFLGRYTWKL